MNKMEQSRDVHPSNKIFHNICIQFWCVLLCFVVRYYPMMTSSNRNIFRVIGPFCWNSPVTGEFPSQRPVTRNFDFFFDLRLNKRLSKQSWSWWFEMPSHPLWRHSNALLIHLFVVVNFDALVQASDIRIERRQVVFLCWMQDSNPSSQTPIRQQTECLLTNRLSYRGSS